MVVGFIILAWIGAFMGLSFAYSLGKQRGRTKARRVIGQGLQSGKVSLYGSTYSVTAVEFPERATRRGYERE